MSELRGPAGKNVVVTGDAKTQGYRHVLAFAEAGCDIAVLDVARPAELVPALATVEMVDATVEAVEERGVRCHQLPRVAA